MLTTDEIKVLIDNDKISDKKQFARAGERYYDGDHDIKNTDYFTIMLMANSARIRHGATSRYRIRSLRNWLISVHSIFCQATV